MINRIALPRFGNPALMYDSGQMRLPPVWRWVKPLLPTFAVPTMGFLAGPMEEELG